MMRSESMEVVFLCGARDYHAMDWYRSAIRAIPGGKVAILTDLVSGEGYEKLVTDLDSVHRLLVLDKLLFSSQSGLGNLWRNLLKLAVFPIQVVLLKRFSKMHPDAIYLAHSMYYLWLACAARVPYIGTPQGSDILIRPYRSRLYLAASRKALKEAMAVTVDSRRMASAVYEIAGVRAEVIQNGIDVSTIAQEKRASCSYGLRRSLVVSMRAVAPLYRILEILEGRKRVSLEIRQELQIIYPFYEAEYLSRVSDLMCDGDKNLGRVTRKQMYDLFFRSVLVISIPESDSSPRSVYEAIFCGAAVAIVYHAYVDMLPACMRKRVILVDLQDKRWFAYALKEARIIVQAPFHPSDEALDMFDQLKSFRRVKSLLDHVNR